MPSPAATAASRCCSAERASRRPCGRAADRAALYLTRFLPSALRQRTRPLPPSSASSCERGPSGASCERRSAFCCEMDHSYTASQCKRIKTGGGPRGAGRGTCCPRKATPTPKRLFGPPQGPRPPQPAGAPAAAPPPAAKPRLSQASPSSKGADGLLKMHLVHGYRPVKSKKT